MSERVKNIVELFIGTGIVLGLMGIVWGIWLIGYNAGFQSARSEMKQQDIDLAELQASHIKRRAEEQRRLHDYEAYWQELYERATKRQPFAWPIAEADYRKAVICDAHPAIGVYADEKGAHVHCPEELNGGGYRNGKFVYLKDVAQ